MRYRRFLLCIGVVVGLAGVAATPAPTASLRWQDTRPLPQPAGGLAAAAANGYLFVSGGYNGSYQWAGYSARIVPSDGSLSTWRHITSLPVPLYEHAMATAFGSLYVVGGTTNGLDTGAQNAVYRTRLEAGGRTGRWAQAGKLPLRIYGQGVVIAGAYLYMAGGYTPDQGYASGVYGVKLNDHGFAGSWLRLPALPRPRFGTVLVAGRGYLFAVGGMSQGQVANTVYVARLNKDGTLVRWQATRGLPAPVAQAGAAVVGGWLVVAGGTTGLNLTGPVTTVVAAPITAAGQLGAWKTLTGLRSPTAAPVVVTDAGKYVYVLGGYNGKVYNSSIAKACPPFVATCGAARIPAGGKAAAPPTPKPKKKA